MVNKVFLIGRIGQSPQFKTLESGASVAKFSLATSERFKDRSGEWEEQTQWHNVIAWRFLADRVQKQFKKGTLVHVEGKLTHRKVIKDDVTRYYTEVVASSLKTLKDGIPRDDHMPGEEDSPSFPSASSSTLAQPTSADMIGGGDDLPF